MFNNSRDTIKYSKVTIGCIALLVSAVVAYLYFLNMSVVQVVLRTEFTQQQNQLHAEIASLEAKYITSQHQIASRIAVLDGYQSQEEKIFVSRDQASFVLSSN